MSTLNRREFLQRSQTAGLGLVAGITILADPRSVRAAPAQERLSVAVVGVRSRGHALTVALAQRDDCRVSYLCDADSRLLKSRAESVTKASGGHTPKGLPDFRHALDDKTVDALVVATPDHWHCLSTIWACQAGKDVYVEAPLSHNAWEGQRTVACAREHGRIVQVGMETRSAAYAQSAKEFLQAGKLGKIHFCRVLDQKGQGNFPVLPDSKAPAGLDWDAWNGPAPAAAFNANALNNWLGMWRYSGGDMAVEGIHALDLARWLLGLEYPRSVYATGGRFDAAGGNQTPDTLTALYEFDQLLLSFELTLNTPYMLRVSPAVRNGDLFPYWPQSTARVEIYGSEGLMIIGPLGGGWQVFVRPRREQPIVSQHGDGSSPDADHLENFLRAVRSRATPHADVAEGHRSALLVHYANLSYRAGGEKLIIDAKSEQITNSPRAMQWFQRSYRKPWVIE